MLKLSLAATLIASTLAMGTAAAGAAIDFGSIVSGHPGYRVISVTPQTRSINVTNGETVTIASGSKTFSWHVDTFPREGQFKLSDVAPGEADLEKIKVYVSPNPTYFGG
jgi:hypothetical protein